MWGQGGWIFQSILWMIGKAKGSRILMPFFFFFNANSITTSSKLVKVNYPFIFSGSPFYTLNLQKNFLEWWKRSISTVRYGSNGLRWLLKCSSCDWGIEFFISFQTFISLNVNSHTWVVGILLDRAALQLPSKPRHEDFHIVLSNEPRNTYLWSPPLIQMTKCAVIHRNWISKERAGHFYKTEESKR